MITLHVIVTNTTTVKVIMEGVKNSPKIDYVICERSLSTQRRYESYIFMIIMI